MESDRFVSTSFRAAVERRSAALLLYLNSLPRAVPFTAMGAVLLAGLMTSGVLSFALLLVVALFLAWLAFVSWPHVSPGGRLVRAAVTVLVAAVAVSQLG